MSSRSPNSLSLLASLVVRTPAFILIPMIMMAVSSALHPLFSIYNDGGDDGVHPNSHKHFIPYMGFCASIWDSVRHHCHHHHHHHDHQK